MQQEVHLAQREIVESERQIRAHVGVGCLFVGQRDVEANRTCADLESTAVGGLHDAGPTPGDDDEITAVLLLETRRNKARETPRLLVVTCLFDPAIGSGKLLPQPDILRSDERLTLQHAKTGFCRLGIAHACAAEDHYRRANALLVQDAVRLEQFELQSQRPQFFLAKQLDVFVRKTVRWRLADGAQAFIEIFGGLHHSCARKSGQRSA